MKKLLLTLLLILLLPGLGEAQNFKFRKVSQAEVAETQHPLEADAEAAYLYRYRSTYYTIMNGSYQLMTDIHQRIKFYSDSESAMQYATHEVSLYDGSDGPERVVGLKAYTYNQENGKMEEIKMDKASVFEEQRSKRWKKLTFTLPEVREGSVIEFKYTIQSDYEFHLTPFTYQFGIPVNKVDYKFRAPEYFQFAQRMKGYLHYLPKESFTNNAQLEVREKVYEFDFENIPSLKGEKYVDNINNYRAGMNFELSLISVPGVYHKSYSQSWEDVTKFIYNNSFHSELIKKGYFDDVVDPIVQSVSDPMKRMASIFDLVKDHMNWNENYGYYPQEGVRKAFKERTGNVSDINLMLTAMLRYAGLKANPVLVSTKANGIPLFPTSDGFNYVIAAVEIENGVILLDATSKLAAPNVLPLRAMNWMGRLIREDDSSTEVDLSAAVKSRDIVNIFASLKEDGSMEAKMRRQRTAHEAFSFRNTHWNQDEEEYLEELENDMSGVEIMSYELTNKEEIYKPLIETLEFQKEEAVERISGKIYLSPLLFLKTSENPFKAEKREFPIDFGYAHTNRYMINFTLPEGYQVESLPENIKFALPENLGSFAYSLKQAGNTLQIMVNQEINQDLISAEYYQFLKAFFSEMISKYEERVVLSKV